MNHKVEQSVLGEHGFKSEMVETVVSIDLFFPSNCLFSYNGVYQDAVELSTSDIIICQKGSNGDGKLHFFERDYNFTRSLRKNAFLGRYFSAL